MDKTSSQSVVVGSHKQAQLDNSKLAGPPNPLPAAAPASDSQVLYKLVKINQDGSYTAVSENDASRLLHTMLDANSLSDCSDADSEDEAGSDSPPFAHQSMQELQAEEHRLLQKMRHLNEMLRKFEEEDQQRQAKKGAPALPEAVGGSAATAKHPPQSKVRHESNGVQRQEEGDNVSKGDRGGAGNGLTREGHSQAAQQTNGSANGSQKVERREIVEPRVGGGNFKQDTWQDQTAQQPSFLNVPRVSRKRKRGTTRARQNLHKLLAPLREAVRRKTAPVIKAGGVQVPAGAPLQLECGEQSHGNGRVHKGHPQMERASSKQANGQELLAPTPSLPPLLNGFEGFGVDSTALPWPWSCGQGEDLSFVKAFDLQSLDGNLSLDQAWEEGLNRADLELGISSPRKKREPSVDHSQKRSVHGRVNEKMNGAGVGAKQQKDESKDGARARGGFPKQHKAQHTESRSGDRVCPPGGDMGCKAGQSGQQSAPLAKREGPCTNPAVGGSSGPAAVKLVTKAARSGETSSGAAVFHAPPCAPEPSCSSQLDKRQPFAKPAAKRSKLLPSPTNSQARAGNENRVPGRFTGHGHIGVAPLMAKKKSGSSQQGRGLLRDGGVTAWGDNVGRSGS